MIISFDVCQSGLHLLKALSPLPNTPIQNLPILPIFFFSTEMRHVILLNHKVSIMHTGPDSWLINGSYQENDYFYIFMNTAAIFFQFSKYAKYVYLPHSDMAIQINLCLTFFPPESY